MIYQGHKVVGILVEHEAPDVLMGDSLQCPTKDILECVRGQGNVRFTKTIGNTGVDRVHIIFTEDFKNQ